MVVYYMLQSKGVLVTLLLVTVFIRAPGGHVKAKGNLYLSNIRMVFVAKKPVGNFVAFDMPLVWIFEHSMLLEFFIKPLLKQLLPLIAILSFLLNYFECDIIVPACPSDFHANTIFTMSLKIK